MPRSKYAHLVARLGSIVQIAMRKMLDMNLAEALKLYLAAKSAAKCLEKTRKTGMNLMSTVRDAITISLDRPLLLRTGQ